MRGRWFIGDDIPMNILSRLSTKTLHFFKLVSKDWFNLISDRSFVKLQLKRSEPVSGFFFQEVFEWSDDADVEDINYIPIAGEEVNVCQTVLDFLPDNVVILSLNNGLICCRTTFPNSHPMIYVCNPLNKQWTSLMWPGLPKICSIALAFDPFRDSMDFTLIALRIEVVETHRGEVADEEGYETDEEDEYCFSFHIYSSKNRSWRASKESCKCSHTITKNKGVLVDGNMYWLIDHAYGVLMFDHQNELSCLVSAPIPPREFTYTPEMCIGESQGKLNYVMISEYGLQLWVLEDHFASKWDLKFCVSLDELERENLTVLFNLEEKIQTQSSRMVNGWKDPSEVDPLAFKDGVMLVRVATSFYLYEFGKGKMKKLCDVSTLGPKAMFSPIVVPYTMSLAPVE